MERRAGCALQKRITSNVLKTVKLNIKMNERKKDKFKTM